MARYTYNAGLVTQTIDKLYSACDSLDSTNVDIQKGIDMILNARGAENINVDFTPITGYQSSVIEYIETMTTEINKKAQEIEEYQDAPWYKKLFATIGMGALKLVEGLATFVENIGDCLVSIVGFIGGIFSSDFRDCLGEFVKKDWVGDTTAKWYEEGWLKDVNKYSIMSHESTAANVLKGIGVAAGYVIISVATAGAGTAVSLGVSAATAAAGAIGAGTQSGLQAGMTFNQAFGQGVKQGAVAAATTLVIGGIANKLGNLAKGVGGAIDDAGAAIANSADDVLAITAGTADDVLAITAGAADDVANAAINSADDVANALVNSADDVANVAANAADDVANAAINSTDDVANAAANATDDVANATDDVVKAGDDALEVVGEKTTSDGRKWLKVKDSNGTPDLVEVGTGRSGVQGTQYTAEQLKNIGINVGDDIANSLDDVANSADDVVNAAANSADDVTNAAVNSADDLTNAASKKPNIIQKVANKVDKTITNFGTNTKVGQALSNAAAKAGPTVTNAVATGAGAVAGGSVTAPSASSAYRVAMQEAATPSIGEQLYTEGQAAIDGNLPSTATADQAAANLQNLQDQGYNPGSGSTDTLTTNSSVSAPAGITGGNGGSSGGSSYTVTADQVELPEYPSTGGDAITTTDNNPIQTQNPNNIASGESASSNLINPTPPPNGDIPQTNPISQDDIIGTVNPNSESTYNPRGVSNVTGNGSNVTGTIDTVSSEVMDTFGNASGSLSEISGSKTSIPSSSSPILSSENSSSKSMIPLGAGLGAAAVAGIGAKAVLDKREKAKEDSDEIETEEWSEANDVEVDYGLDSEENSDYLSPTDELAYQE